MKIFIAIVVGLIFMASHCQVQVIQDDSEKKIPFLGDCKWNKKTKVCQDPTKKCQGKFCCKTTGKIIKGIPQCKCSSILAQGSCDTCVYTGVATQCKDSSPGKCAGNSCCQASFFPRTNQFQCKCTDCPPIDTCRWNKQFKKCQDPKGICVGDKCCKLTGKYLTDGTPQCTCTGSALKGDCDTCIWTGNQDFCKDPKENCVGDLCCKAKYFPGGNDFTCGCSVCNQPSCKWNEKEKKCRDPTGVCSGDRCCKPSGKIDAKGIPKCLCQPIPTGQTYCDSCVWSGEGAICKDPTGKCIENKCCQPSFFSGSKQFTCNCESCSQVTDRCIWNPTTKKCNDPTKQCVGDKCCKPSGKILTDGTPHCSCTGSALKGDCDGCQWNPKNKNCFDVNKKCKGVKCCKPSYFLGQIEFQCKCQTCIQIPPFDFCQWNQKMKKCQDPLKTCVGEKCCLPNGKILKSGVPQCECKGSANLGQCDNCVWTGLSNICKDNTGKCNGVDSCCQAKSLDNKNFACQCGACQDNVLPACQWNEQKNVCEDINGQCKANNGQCINLNGPNEDPKCGCGR